MKTEEIRATEIAITPYLTLILFSMPDSVDSDRTTSSRSRHIPPAAAGASGKPEWRLPPLAESAQGDLSLG